MFNFLLEALDLWTDAPRKLKGWLYGIAFALAIIGAAFVLDRCAPDWQAPSVASPP